MRILAVSNTSNNNHSIAPSFGYRLPKRVFSDMREIPELGCACCNKKMLTKEKLQSIMKRFFPRSTNTTKSIETEKSFNAPNVIKKLQKFSELLNKENSDLLDLMEIYALKYPKNTFSEIFQKPEILKHHEKIIARNKERKNLKKVKVFKNIRMLASVLSKKDIKLSQEINTKALTILHNDYYNRKVKSNLVKELYQSFFDNCSDKKVARKIVKESKKLPFERNFADTFIIDNGKNKKTDREIIKLILENMESTFEHVKAKYFGGTDSIKNGITLCKQCNQERNNIPYPQFLKIYPQMKKNVQKQIDKIIVFINRKKLIKHENYPIEVKQTLLNETDNKIKLNIKKYLDYKEKIALSKLDRAKASANENQKHYQKAQDELNATEKKLEEVMETIRRLKKDKAHKKAVLNTATTEKENISKRLEEFQSEFDNIQELIKKDDAL